MGHPLVYLILINKSEEWRSRQRQTLLISCGKVLFGQNRARTNHTLTGTVTPEKGRDLSGLKELPRSVLSDG
jgi:hypothetical protein